MNEPSFRPERLSARVEKHLSYEQLIDYLVALEGQEQIRRVSVGEPTPGGGAADHRILSRALLKLVGTVGSLSRLSSPEGYVAPHGSEANEVTLSAGLRWVQRGG